MAGFSDRALFWAPRAISIAFIAFLSLFALDVFSEGYGFWRTLLALGIHLIPSFVLLAILLLALRWEWIGAAAYAAAGAIYVAAVLPGPIPPETKLIWILTVAGPAFLISVLFLANWRKRRELRAGR
jgi:hypothetical protein